ncbi:MAG: hypothetical protein KDA41_05950 [Planctomycetales bacterium]|nr:hypothetical protein [Planctomycetales bacterium]
MADDSAPPPAAKSSPLALRVILFGLLFAAIAMLAWDRYASAVSQSAHEALVKLIESEDPADKTPDAVHKMVGRQPDKGLEEFEHHYRETYSWPRGRLYDTYYVVALYAKEDGKPMLHEAVMNVEPEENDIPRSLPIGDGSSGDPLLSGELPSGEEQPSGVDTESTDAGEPTDNKPTDTAVDPPVTTDTEPATEPAPETPPAETSEEAPAETPAETPAAEEGAAPTDSSEAAPAEAPAAVE